MSLFKSIALVALLLLVAATGVYSAVALHSVKVTLEGLEPRTTIHMSGSEMLSKWTSGGIQREFSTHKGDCTPPCPDETGAEHAARHKSEFGDMLAEFPKDV